MFFEKTSTMIWKGIYVGNRGYIKLFQSNEVTLGFGGGAIVVNGMPSFVERDEWTQNT